MNTLSSILAEMIETDDLGRKKVEYDVGKNINRTERRIKRWFQGKIKKILEENENFKNKRT